MDDIDYEVLMNEKRRGFGTRGEEQYT